MLPKCGEFSREDNYCENLRPAAVAGSVGLVPVGHPRAVMSAGAHVCVLPDGRIVSVGSDHRTVSVNGADVGRLGADFRAAMADGDRIAIFTDAGVQWVAAGRLQADEAEAIDVGLSVAPAVVELSAALDLPSKLKGSYARLSGPLQDVDCQTFSAAFAKAMKSLSAQAALRGMLTQPALIGWRMLDADGRVVAQGEPRRFGSLQGGDTVAFTATKDGSTFTLTGYGAMKADAWSVRLRVGRSASEFWRRRARVLEVIAYRNGAAVAGVTGHFAEKSGSESTLSVAPVIVDATPADGVVAARFDLPLEGLDTTVFLTDLASLNIHEPTEDAEFIPTEVCYGGTLRLYALSGEPGVVGVARASDPLTLRIKGRICEGSILRICAPAGSGGGWNYGRHHFLAFTTAGIYAVSVDTALKSLSAIQISAESVVRADAVAGGVNAVFCVTAGGKLLKLTGSRVSRIDLPHNAVAVGWSPRYSELWVAGSGGSVLTLTAGGGAYARKGVTVGGFVEPGFAISSSGELLTLNDEEPETMSVCWLRRCPEAATSVNRRDELLIDSAQATDLRIIVSGDGGGGRRRFVELKINGEVNAPLKLNYRAPHRAYKTLEINGRLAAGSRLVGLRPQSRMRKC